MRRRPKYPQLANIVFLDKVGETLRQVTSEILRLWRLACEAVANGHPKELSDGTRRFHVFGYPFLLNGKRPVPG